MEHVLLVIHVLIATALIGVVLIQRSETDGFGLGSGSGSNLMTGRAAANLLTRTTAILATLFIVNSLALSIMAARGGKDSIVDSIVAEDAAAPVVPMDEKPAADKKAAPAVEKANQDRAKAPAADADAPAVPTAE